MSLKYGINYVVSCFWGQINSPYHRTSKKFVSNWVDDGFLCLCVCVCLLCRTKLLESEAMNESLRRNLNRVSSRLPYTLGLSPGIGLGDSRSPATSVEAEASEVLQWAKQDLERLKKETKQRRKR